MSRVTRANHRHTDRCERETERIDARMKDIFPIAFVLKSYEVKGEREKEKKPKTQLENRKKALLRLLVSAKLNRLLT